MPDFDAIRSNLRRFSKGVFEPPRPHGHPDPRLFCINSDIALPPKPIADRLLQQYRAALHHVAPMLHWPTFQTEYEQLYLRGTFQGLRRIWRALFFAALACGSIVGDAMQVSSNSEAGASRFCDIAKSDIRTIDDDVSVDHVRVCLLLSICFMDMNRKPSSWFWLSSAVRFAQYLGLHRDQGQYTGLESEMQKRVWWSAYNWDK